jgi:hypothetical protein
MAKKQFDADGNVIADPPAKMVRFRFLKIWSTPDGAYFPGQEAELPIDIAESLYLEEAGEILTAGA